MSLGKKIIILATLVVLGIQCLSSVLEIGFLYKRIKSGYLAKYKLSGMLIKRKLERSLLYGKKIETLNYARLLKGLVHEDISNIAVVDNNKNILFSLNNSLDIQRHVEIVERESAVFKFVFEFGYCNMAFPLFQGENFEGDLFVFISDKGIKDKILPIINEMLIQCSIIFLALIFMLYWILRNYMEKPFGKYIDTLKKAIAKKDQKTLNLAGVDMQEYFDVEKIIDTLKGDKWLKGEEQLDSWHDEYQGLMHMMLMEYYNMFRKVKSTHESRTSMDQNTMIDDPWEYIDDNMRKYVKNKSDYDFVISVQRLWTKINGAA